MNTKTKDITVKTKLSDACVTLELINEEHVSELKDGEDVCWDSLSIKLYQNIDTQVVTTIRINTITISDIQDIANTFRLLYENMSRRTRLRTDIKNLNERFDELR